MRKVLHIHFLAVDESHPALQMAIVRLKGAGYRVSRRRKVGDYMIRAPGEGDNLWESEVESLKNMRVIDYVSTFVDIEHNDQEIQEAGLFIFSCKPGKDVDAPSGPDGILGLADLADWDDSKICSVCGAGAVQISPMRIPASSLAKRRLMTEPGVDVGKDLLVSEEARRLLLDRYAIELPLREVQQTGRKPPKEQWWQVMPEMALPAEFLTFVNVKEQKCLGCRRSRWRRDDPTMHSAAYISWRTFDPGQIDAAIWWQDWDGDILRSPDGRILSLPRRMIYLRGDLGRALREIAPAHIDLTPLEWL
jgi:hypothetical protein